MHFFRYSCGYPSRRHEDAGGMPGGLCQTARRIADGWTATEASPAPAARVIGFRRGGKPGHGLRHSAEQPGLVRSRIAQLPARFRLIFQPGSEHPPRHRVPLFWQRNRSRNDCHGSVVTNGWRMQSTARPSRRSSENTRVQSALRAAAVTFGQPLTARGLADGCGRNAINGNWRARRCRAVSEPSYRQPTSRLRTACTTGAINLARSS